MTNFVCLLLAPKTVANFPAALGPAAKLMFDQLLQQLARVRSIPIQIYDMQCPKDSMSKLSTVNEDVFLLLGRLGVEGRGILTKFLTLSFAESEFKLGQLALVPTEGASALYITRIFEGDPNSFHFSINYGRIPPHLRREKKPDQQRPGH